MHEMPGKNTVYLQIEGIDSKKSNNLISCLNHGIKEEEEGVWRVGEDDVVSLFNLERNIVVQDAKAGKYISESRYLLLSFVLEVPLDAEQFVLGSKKCFLKKMRANLIPSIRKARFRQEILLMFLSVKRAWELEDKEDVDFLLYEMKRASKESKKNEEQMLSHVLGATLSKLKNWKKEGGNEQDFVDQHLYPFLDCIFLQDKKYGYTQSNGLIPHANKETSFFSSSSRKKKEEAEAAANSDESISSAKSNFFVFYPLDNEKFGLLCVEVKKPGYTGTQSLSDRSNLALEMKRSIDTQAFYGVHFPRCLGLLVDGLSATSFVAELTSHGLYTFLELEEFSLLRGKADLGILPDTVLSFCWLKSLVDEAANMIKKKRKTAPDAGISASNSYKLVKPTVAFPTKKSNSSRCSSCLI
ncbi:hypothetical protein A0J61_09904 [Choanephora cucurbitarum]|uniref:Uncharacterized protein n=1 Tax=Choanephora cucurbitarum TaxID=101091 RepID=A0A1C7N047_9FUNG|nr:hypothetical protein A0J61_09904 [Choanephora cucurbitarum]